MPAEIPIDVLGETKFWPIIKTYGGHFSHLISINYNDMNAFP